MTNRDIEAAADSIAGFCDKPADRDGASKAIVALVNRAVLAERERCAKVCEAEAGFAGSTCKKDASALNCAAAIRNGNRP